MPKTRTEKEAKVAEVAERLGAAKAVYLADLTGMSVEMLTGFRRMCRENGIRLEVVKNTLIHRASRDTAVRDAGSRTCTGPTALMTDDRRTGRAGAHPGEVHQGEQGSPR